MSVLVYLGDDEETAAWVRLLTPLLEGLEVRPLDDPGPKEAAEYAVVWGPPPGRLAALPNLRATVSVGAGIDHVLRDPEYPRHVPILRTTGPDMIQRMREYVALHVLAHHRRLRTTDDQQTRREWAQLVTPVASKRRVGVLGLGEIGGASAASLAALGFDVLGWARTAKEIPGVRCFAGEDGFAALLAEAEILVCLLPLTGETRAILDRRTFARMKPGASLINVGRGGHLVEEDLLDALETGQIAEATLDVFGIEPLPEAHPFWTHPRIRVTPHVASYIDPETGAGIVAENILAHRAGRSPVSLSMADRGY